MPHLKEMIDPDFALKLVLEHAAPERSEQVSLRQAHQRILAEELASLRTQPPFDASAMDGYAVLSEDLQTLPARLQVVGQSAAGHPYADPVQKGQAVRIFTGAQVPQNADTIIIQENTRALKDAVEILETETPGRYIRKAGLDFKAGEVLLPKNRVLEPQAIALAASMNHAQLPVWKKPVVAIIATGDELVEPGGELRTGQIIASNTYGLLAMCQAAGAQVHDLGIARDSMEALAEKFDEAMALEVDLIITMGGASVGQHDLVLPAFKAQGFDFLFSKIAMRPGKPLLYGVRQGDRLVRMLGLAGNPVSSLVAGHVFVRPLIHKLAGKLPHISIPRPAICTTDLPQNGPRREYMRAMISTGQEGELHATAFPSQDSSMLANLTRAQALLIHEAKAPPLPAGSPCTVILLQECD